MIIESTKYNSEEKKVISFIDYRDYKEDDMFTYLERKNKSIITLPKDDVIFAKKLACNLQSPVIFIVKDLREIEKQLKDHVEILSERVKKYSGHISPEYKDEYITDNVIFSNVLIDNNYHVKLVFVEIEGVEYVSN